MKEDISKEFEMSSFSVDADGYPLVVCEGNTVKMNFWPVRYTVGLFKYDPMATRLSKLHDNQLFNEGYRCRLTFYGPTNIYKAGSDCYDHTENFPFLLKTPDALHALVNGFKECKKKRQIELEKKEEEEKVKAEKEEKEREMKKRIFPIKGSATPTNPWKKVAATS